MGYSENLIRLEDAAFQSGGQPCVGPMTLELRERRIGIAGRNGAGKSSMLRLLAGLDPPTEGRVVVRGMDPARERRWAVGNIGMIFQNPDRQIIFPTVEEELAFGLKQLGRSRDSARNAVRECLERHGRADWAHQQCHSLSQGQQHFLCLLAVLLMEPAILLLDEPFSGLDLPTSTWLKRELRSVGQQTILATHDVDLLGTCDRVIWLERGIVAGDGPPAEVLPVYLEAMKRLARTNVGKSRPEENRVNADDSRKNMGTSRAGWLETAVPAGIDGRSLSDFRPVRACGRPCRRSVTCCDPGAERRQTVREDARSAHGCRPRWCSCIMSLSVALPRESASR